MENFVQMSLETYDTLKSNIEYLKRTLKDERELRSKDSIQAERTIKDLAKKIEQYKKYILELRCDWLDVENNSLEYYLDINSWSYGMNDKDKLLSMGFTKEEMDEFIADEYEEYVKEKEENKKEENTDD